MHRLVRKLRGLELGPEEQFLSRGEVPGAHILDLSVFRSVLPCAAWDTGQPTREISKPWNPVRNGLSQPHYQHCIRVDRFTTSYQTDLITKVYFEIVICVSLRFDLMVGIQFSVDFDAKTGWKLLAMA